MLRVTAIEKFLKSVTIPEFVETQGNRKRIRRSFHVDLALQDPLYLHPTANPSTHPSQVKKALQTPHQMYDGLRGLFPKNSGREICNTVEDSSVAKKQTEGEARPVA